MFKPIFFHGLLAGVLSGIACIIYRRIHEFATYTDFSRIMSPVMLMAVNIGACMIAAIGFWLLTKQWQTKGEIVFNFLFSILSFASIMWPISAKLPLDVKYPELFPGLAVPMHFFPALAWYTLRPIFVTSQKKQNNHSKI